MAFCLGLTSSQNDAGDLESLLHLIAENEGRYVLSAMWQLAERKDLALQMLAFITFSRKSL